MVYLVGLGTVRFEYCGPFSVYLSMYLFIYFLFPTFYLLLLLLYLSID